MLLIATSSSSEVHKSYGTVVVLNRVLFSSSSEASWLLWCPNHGRHSPQSHLSQPLHPHRKCGQWPQCGLSQHGQSVFTKPLSHMHRNPDSMGIICGQALRIPHVRVESSKWGACVTGFRLKQESLQSTNGLLWIQPVSGTIQRVFPLPHAEAHECVNWLHVS